MGNKKLFTRTQIGKKREQIIEGKIKTIGYKIYFENPFTIIVLCQ